MPPSPRPWYLSLTLVWEDDQAGLSKLNQALRGLLAARQLVCPAHHRLVPRKARHSTAFAILKINRVPCPGMSLRQLARELLMQLAPTVRVDLAEAWGSGLSLEAHEVRAYDDATAVQFRARPDGCLADFRDRARKILAKQVGELLSAYPSGVLESLIYDCTKSRGDNAFGSIARSPCRSDKSDLRWALSLTDPVTLTFTGVHLLTSDDALTNPRTPGEDYLIP